MVVDAIDQHHVHAVPAEPARGIQTSETAADHDDRWHTCSIPMRTSLFIGIDIGGSGVRAAVANSRGDVLAHAAGATLDDALRGIVARVGGEPCSVFAGARGVSVPWRREQLVADLVVRFPAGEVRVSSDAEIALWGGLAGGEGVVVAATERPAWHDVVELGVA